MDRQKLIDLFRKGMEYPTGKHRFWIARCFEITVRADQVVELDEYESFSHRGTPDSSDMFHVGRSVLHLKEGKIIDQDGEGWKPQDKKPLDKRGTQC